MVFTIKGKTFESNLSNVEAIAAIENLPSTFAGSLLSQYKRSGKLSVNQWPWVHKLALEASRPVPAPVDVPDCTLIRNLFDTAIANGMKRAKVAFDDITFALAGRNSRRPGAIYVSTGFGGKYFGYIGLDGKFMAGKDFSELPRESFEGFASDPKGYSANAGLKTGACRYCCKGLSTYESLGVGYGPICAKKWNLPWGEK